MRANADLVRLEKARAIAKREKILIRSLMNAFYARQHISLEDHAARIKSKSRHHKPKIQGMVNGQLMSISEAAIAKEMNPDTLRARIKRNGIQGAYDMPAVAKKVFIARALTQKVIPDLSHLKALTPDQETLIRMQSWRDNGASDEQILFRLRSA